jgi:DNA primase
LLYNLHHARPSIRRAEKAIVVEGFFDVLRAVEVDVENVVAPLGTALTSDQAALLKRYTTEVVLLYDNDHAGMRASFRAADRLLRSKIRVTIATLPQGEDPDSVVVKGGAAALTEIASDAMDVFERELQLLDRKGWMGTLAGRRRALDRLLPTLRAAADPVTQDLYVSRAADTLGITAESIRREVNSGPLRSLGTHHRNERTERSRGSTGTMSAERNLTRVMVHEPQWRSRILEQVPDPSVLREPDRELFAYLSIQPDDVGAAEMLGQVQGEARTVLADVLREEWGEQLDVDAIVDGSLNSLRSRSIEVDLETLQRRLTVASEDEKLEIVHEIEALVRQLSALKPGRWNAIRTGRGSAV